MTAVDLLLRLRALDVTVALDGERLKVSAPAGGLDDAVRAELVAKKAELIAFLRQGLQPAGDAVRALPRRQGVPLSFTQQRFWFFHNLVPDTSAYHVCFGLRFEGPLDTVALSRALDEVVRRQELLRTRFSAPEGHPVQTVMPAAPVAVPVVDLSPLGEREKQARFEALAREAASEPFDLTARAPLRLTLFTLAPDDHALVVAMHHIASDAWSVTAFIRELAALYEAFSSAGPSPLADLRVQYADFASWQHERQSDGTLDRQREYWARTLADAPTLQLPADRPRPAFQTFRGGRAEFSLPKRLAEALAGVARQERASLFMALLAGFYGLLHRYSGQTDLVVGTAIAGRSRPELEPLIGPFINTLALRTDAAGDPTFRTLLGRARETCLDAYANQDLPFEKVVDALRLDRALDRNPLFQVMLALQNVPPPPRDVNGVRLSAFDIDRGTTVSDLEIIFWPTDNGLEGYVRYSADLFEAATVRRLLDHFEVLLEAAAANPDRRVSDLPLLTPAEQDALARWNQTSTLYPRTIAVHRAFEQQALRTPDAPAVVWRGRRWSYRELDARANRLAHRLLARGVVPEERVAIHLERSADFVTAALAVLKAGAAYLPIETTCPADRLRFTIEDAGVRFVIAAPALDARVRNAGAAVLTPDGEDSIGALDGDAPHVDVAAGQLAYVIYTSGSTGRPKGVSLSHRGLQNLVAWHRRVYGVTASDRASLVAGLGFDASVWELWPYLLSGACVHVPEEETRGSAALLLEWLAESGVSLCFAPTPLAEAMFDSPMPANLSLRSLLTGGDTLHRVPAGLPFEVYNNYGPTESTVVTTSVKVRGGSDAPPSIGFPVDNTCVHVLDRGLRQVPVGVPGELYIASDSLARGYLNRPDLTAERFIPDPFSVQPGGRMYRTGDLVRRLAAGDLDFLGRLDDQVKVRGFRIELGEIEAVLASHPAVRDAVVVAREGRAGNRRLVAYATSRAGVLPIPAIAAYLEDRLPDYMVPSAIVPLEALPLTANGKIDRRALPEPAAAAGTVQEPAVLSSDTERTLAAIWARVLRVERVGPHDNFFEAGGDSILALQVIAAARQQGLRLTPRQVFEYPTIAALAARAAVDAPAATAVDDASGDVPLTPIQRLFLEQDVPEPHHFNQAAMFVATERLDVSRLRGALERLVEHHDALRLRFVRGASGWQQAYAPPGTAVPVDVIDLSTVAPAERTAAMTAAADRVQAGFDLANGPLVRAAVFDFGAAAPQRLLVTVHHLVIDTVSWRILVADLVQAYQDLAAGRTPQLPAKSASFKAWATRLAAHVAGEPDPAETQYWRDTCAVRASIPIDGAGGTNLAGSTRMVSLSVSPADTEALLRDVPKTSGLQIHEVLLTAVARAVTAWSGNLRVVIDLESHGRDALFDDLNLSRTVGWFTSLYPVVIDLAGADDPGSALKRVKQQMRGVPNRGIGYGILRYLRPAIDPVAPAVTADAPVSFNYLGQFGGDSGGTLLVPAAEPAGALNSPRMPRPHLIDVSAHVAEGQLRLAVYYSEALHRRATVDAFAHGIGAALAELIGHCRTADAGGFTPSDFPEANVSQEDLDRLLERIGQAESYS